VPKWEDCSRLCRLGVNTWRDPFLEEDQRIDFGGCISDNTLKPGAMRVWIAGLSLKSEFAQRGCRNDRRVCVCAIFDRRPADD